MKREGIRATKAENFPGQKIQYLFIHKCCMGMVWSLWKTEDSGESKGSKRKEKIPRQAVYGTEVVLQGLVITVPSPPGQPCSIFLPQHLLGSPAKYLRNVILNSNSIFLFTLCLMLVLWKKRKNKLCFRCKAFPTTCIYNHPQNSFLKRHLQIRVKSTATSGLFPNMRPSLWFLQPFLLYLTSNSRFGQVTYNALSLASLSP